ncbi:hypothetical protein Metev_2378 (plasmid) [Methanohalobium evestigatum Z-7303]|uniref:ORC1/DEAH AAA+ ATPase domain-containing protein n=1 Tax=Methanohalobium evestigatum (strain ATCC BAA-1072 / DSM 3721 / NBRC 107634 / OCM 161 / Z-7303) TaxID=644295 RepID=D7EC63_METEZ|nr:ATP-binding protein [Methanohalobium evestigatum]ADI75185.1 hypothetical protein Metev_2378 [Methanohalobium evestigatum Z-7303]
MAKEKAKNRMEFGLKGYPMALQEYCKQINWDPEKVRIALTDEGIADEMLYLDEPNVQIVDVLTRFLSLSESSIFVIHAPVGMGKSSIRDFTLKTLNESDDYYITVINNPRLTPLQILKQILRDITAEEKTPRTMDLVWNKAKNILSELKETGISTIIWIDEAEKLDNKKLSLLRALADVKTFDGEKVCKIVLTGTPTLKKKVENFLEANPEDAEAFDDRSGFYTYELSKWSSNHILEWWELLCEYCSTDDNAINPFTKGAADEVIEFSDGKPRTITQITQMVLFDTAARYFNEETDIWISQDDVLNALSTQIQEENSEQEQQEQQTQE